MQDYEQLYKNFVTSFKSLLIAPAGFGKTHTIAECLGHSLGHQLILTHTHAGVASIKEKLKKNLPACNYTIETISGFAQKYVEAFYCGVDIPAQDDNSFFCFIIEKCVQLVKLRPVEDIIKTTYSGLFVDEYQDCTMSQHELIMVLSKFLPVHLLGDPLQGIFNFNGEKLVDFEKDLHDFDQFTLADPWRWKNKNELLGEFLITVRNNLYSKLPVNIGQLNKIPNCFCLKVSESDLFNRNSDYRKCLNKISYNRKGIEDLENTLILCQGSIWQRAELTKNLSYRFRVLEAFDEKDFFKIASKFDKLKTSDQLYSDLMILLKGRLCSVTQRNGKKKMMRRGTLLTGLAVYFPKDSSIPKPRKEPMQSIISKIEEINSSFSFAKISDILRALINLDNVECPRKELFFELCNTLNYASYKNISVYEAMKIKRNIKRRIGRKIQGRYIGTTLLTKGLEFDTVVVLNAHEYLDPNNLYVALTRATKRLFVFTKKENIFPFQINP